MYRKLKVFGLIAFLVVCLGIAPFVTRARAAEHESAESIQPYLDRMAEAVTEFSLDNGMTFVVQEQHEAPVVSTLMYVNTGSGNEELGRTGIAHFLEHLTFKGTSQIGTFDYEAEKAVLDQLDAVFEELIAAEEIGNEAEVEVLRSRFDHLQTEAATYINQNQFSRIVEQAGGLGLNADTNKDATRYYYDLPSNKLELWFSLASDRFIDPVFREFYKEKSAVAEERFLSDNSPGDQLFKRFYEVAFDPGHPYHHPILGSPEDIHRLTRTQVTDFFKTYYDPSNLVAVLVGDVEPEQAKQWAETYFGRYSAQSENPDVPAPISVTEQTEPRSFSLSLASEPLYIEGYHHPGIASPDSAVYDAICRILADGPTSRLYKALIESQIALNFNCSAGVPRKLSSIFFLTAAPTPEHTVEEVATVIDHELQRLKDEPVEVATLDSVKLRIRSDDLRALEGKHTLAGFLATYEAMTGDWQNAFEALKESDTVSAADIQRVARETFRPANQTSGQIIPMEES